LLTQHLPERLVLVENPGVHRRNQLIARDEVHLQRDDAKKQIAVGGLVMMGHGGISNSRSRGKHVCNQVVRNRTGCAVHRRAGCCRSNLAGSTAAKLSASV
jgi:hypothetical protein